MSVHSLQKKRFESAKAKVHQELVDYFVNLDEQRRSWYFTVAVNSHAKGHYFTPDQAERLVGDLSKHCGIREVNIDTAIAFKTSVRRREEKQKVIQLRKASMPNEYFEEQIHVLYRLIQEKLLEYRQALDLVLSILDYYPAARRAFA